MSVGAAPLSSATALLLLCCCSAELYCCSAAALLSSAAALLLLCRALCEDRWIGGPIHGEIRHPVLNSMTHGPQRNSRGQSLDLKYESVIPQSMEIFLCAWEGYVSAGRRISIELLR